MYTIGQVSKLFNIPISTLRYYDKEGLFPNIERTSGIRQFSEKELETLRVINCLKKSGLEIKEIKQFIQWCNEGSSTYKQRKDLFERQKKQVQAEISRMNKVLDMIKFKCWYYNEAIKDGNEKRLSQIIPKDLPKDIKILYNRTHSNK